MTLVVIIVFLAIVAVLFAVVEWRRPGPSEADQLARFRRVMDTWTERRDR